MGMCVSRFFDTTTDIRRRWKSNGTSSTFEKRAGAPAQRPSCSTNKFGAGVEIGQGARPANEPSLSRILTRRKVRP
jgi:hypothetical protein